MGAGAGSRFGVGALTGGTAACLGEDSFLTGSVTGTVFGDEPFIDIKCLVCDSKSGKRFSSSSTLQLVPRTAHVTTALGALY